MFNGDQPETSRLAQEAPAQTRLFRKRDIPREWIVRLPGIHNRENVAAALCLCRQLGVSDDLIREEVERFTGVEYRLQRIGEKSGIEFVNDSTSTTPVAGCFALDAMDGKRVLLIAGGADKKLDLSPFARAAASKAARIALLEGTATQKLYDALVKAGASEKIVGFFDNLKAAVTSLLNEARPGDVVLLSPGCASFGMFRNEFHRGEVFDAIVKETLES